MMRLFIQNTTKQMKGLEKSDYLTRFKSPPTTSPPFTHFLSNKRSLNSATFPSLPETPPPKKHSHSKSRLRYDYEDNYSAAISLPVPTAILEQKKEDISSLVDLASHSIIEHAARRVDLFFYTLIAYHETQTEPTQGQTALQHGRGRNIEDKSVTQACHSSFFPTLKDEKPQSNQTSSLLNGTHFMDSINATVELPALVNLIDDELENAQHCRKNSLVIIQKVAMGKINPIEGLQQFFEMMEQAFNTLKIQSPTQEKIITLEKEGTFEGTFCEDKRAVTHEYLDSVLRLTVQQKRDCRKKNSLREKCYQNKMKEIKNEILNTKCQEKYESPKLNKAG